MGSLLSKIIFPVAIGLVVTIFAVAVSLSNASQKRARETSIAQAKDTIRQFKLLRTYYTKNVVNKVQAESNLKVSMVHKGERNTIPLPMTMIHDLSKESEEKNLRFQLNLYSRFPFPNRKNRTLDSFAKEALAYLEDNPGGSVTSEESISGKDHIRVAVADRLVAKTCVDCHNAHPDTPKNDWQLGDVRGVLEVILPINLQTDESKQTLLGSAGIIGAVGLAILGILFYRIKKVIKPIDSIIDGLSTSADQLLDASQEISAFSQSLSASTTEQASNIQETSSAMEQMATMANQNSDHSNSADSMVQESREVFDAGSKDVANMSNAMAEINMAFQKINKINRSIDEIAFETNLLSLNASLEAADAGINGKRFSVVADEVRLLSEKASTAAHETVQLIEGANKRIQSGNVIANSLKESFDNVEVTAAKIANLVGEIKAASSEQALGCEHVSRALTHLDQSTQGNAASAQQAPSSSEGLAAQANQTPEVVSQLRQLISGGQQVVDQRFGANGVHPGYVQKVRRSSADTRLRDKKKEPTVSLAR